MKSQVLQGFIAVALVTTQAAVHAQTVLVDGGSQVQIGRYTTQQATPPKNASAPLDVYVHIRFPRQTINTVGEALQHTLLRTGYRLVAHEVLSEPARNLLQLPLPESNRELGPYQAHEILTILLGPAWDLQRDPVKRLVWFTLNEKTLSQQAPVKAVVAAPTASVDPSKVN